MTAINGSFGWYHRVDLKENFNKNIWRNLTGICS
jgi:hypothetical protein